MNLSGRTDLAVERHRADLSIEGTELSEEHYGKITVTRLSVSTPKAAEEIERPQGRYVTVSFHDLLALDATEQRALERKIALETSALCKGVGVDPGQAGRRVLLVGLGNRALTADAIGPRTVERIGATGHLESIDPKCLTTLGCASLFCNIPGVLSDSGIEAAQSASLLVQRLCPSLVIVVDALVARDAERLLSTVQLSDSGIIPGSGIHNSRAALTRESLGVPVIALGVPTVIDARCLDRDKPCDLFVTLKDVDERVRRLSAILAHAIAQHLSLPSELLIG